MAQLDNHNLNSKQQLIWALQDKELRKNIYVPCSKCVKEGIDSQFELSDKLLVCFACGSYITTEDFGCPDYVIYHEQDLLGQREMFVIDVYEEERQRIRELQKLQEEQLRQAKQSYMSMSPYYRYLFDYSLDELKKRYNLIGIDISNLAI